MNVFELTLLILSGALVAGLLGALTGLGGGVVIVPMLTLVFGVDIRYAIGASLVSVIATSSGAASAYLKAGFNNIRVALVLAIATTIGALSGAFLATSVRTSWLGIIFGVVLMHSAYISLKPPKRVAATGASDPLALRLHLNGSYPTAAGTESYQVHGVPLGFALMYLAGILSGLLGIGSGAVKVLAMDRAMKLPFKVSTTTSSCMIGLTAAASVGLYLHRGYIDPGLSMPVMLGNLWGSILGARVLVKARSRVLRTVFSIVILMLAVEMMYNGFKGNL